MLSRGATWSSLRLPLICTAPASSFRCHCEPEASDTARPVPPFFRFASCECTQVDRRWAETAESLQWRIATSTVPTASSTGGMMRLSDLRWLIFACLLLVLALAPATLWAEEQIGQSSQTEQAVAAENPATNPGCPYSVNGSCCEGCQQKAKKAEAPVKKTGGCPCQRARQAAVGSDSTK